MTASKVKKTKLIDFSDQNDIGLMEEICRVGNANVLFRTTDRVCLPVKLVRVKEAVSFISRGVLQEVPAGACVAAYRTPMAVAGSYYVVMLSNPLTIQQLCRSYCKEMVGDDEKLRAVFSLPFKEEILKSNPDALVVNDLRVSENDCISEIKAACDFDYIVGGRIVHYKAGSYIPVLKADLVEKKCRVYYKNASRKREIKQILFAQPTTQVSKLSITGLEVSGRCKSLPEKSTVDGVRKILQINQDTIVIVSNADSSLHSQTLKLMKGQTIALVQGRYPETYTMCVVLPEDLDDLRVKIRYSNRHGKPVTIALQRRKNADLLNVRGKENQRI